MRVKRRPDKDRGESFRKTLYRAQCSDSEGEADSEGSEGTKNSTISPVSDKLNYEEKVKEISKKGRKETTVSEKHEDKEKELAKKGKKETHKKDCEEQNLKERNFSIISRNRITRSLGIYNKAKRSDTILRERLKQKICTKKFEDVNHKTAKDMARVLDCSSFKILPSSYSTVVCQEQDSPVENNHRDQANFLMASPAGSCKTHSSCGSTGTYSHPGAHKVTPHQTTNPQRITPQNEAALAFKTPLQEISKVLTESLKPSETFHGRNFFAEVQGQLRKMYKQSSVNNPVQKKCDSLRVASELQKKCLKRKSVEENGFERETTRSKSLVQGDLEHLHSSKWLKHSERQMDLPITSVSEPSTSSAKKQENELQAISRGPSSLLCGIETLSHNKKQLDLQEKYESTEIKTRERKQGVDKENNLLCSREVQRSLFGPKGSCSLYRDAQETGPVQRSSSFDILDFLDGFDHQAHCQEIQPPLKDYMTPDVRLVSPPKKPTLGSATPPKMFYPRKLY